MSDPTAVLPAGGQTAANPSGWTVDTLSSHFNSLIQELDRRYEQRFVAQEKAIRAAIDLAPPLGSQVAVAQSQITALEAKFITIIQGQKDAIDTAKDIANKAVVKAEAAADKALLESRIGGLKESFVEALSNADKAVSKAEAAAERRFASVNEFRAQLSDQAATFMPRLESIARHEQTAEKITTLQTQVSDRLGSLQSRLDRIEGKSGGINAGWGYLVAAVGLLSTIVFLALAFKG